MLIVFYSDFISGEVGGIRGLNMWKSNSCVRFIEHDIVLRMSLPRQ